MFISQFVLLRWKALVCEDECLFYKYLTISTYIYPMIIHTIRCKNFKSFREETEIKFDDLQGLYKISGRIGSGKTTIGEIIIFGLFGSISGKNNGDLISWGEKHGLVEVWYTCRHDDVYIRRELNSYGQSPMYVEVNGEELQFTNKRNAQAQLESEYMDATRTIMELLCVISFNNFTSLSTLNTKQSKEFLDYVFNFDVLSRYIEGCANQNKEIKRSLADGNAKLSVFNEQLERLKQYVEGDQAAVQASIDNIRKLITDRRTQDNTKIKDIQDQVKQQQIRLNETKTAGTNKKREIDLIKKGKCPTCGAPIKSDGLAAKEQERKILLETYNDISTRIRELTAQISQIETEMNTYIRNQENLIRQHENEILKLKEQERLSSTETKAVKKNINKIKKDIQKLEIDKAEYEQLYYILSNDIKQSVLGSFIPSLNKNISEIAGILNMQFVPVFDITFNCTVRRGDIQIPTSSLSTGQLKMVDMVIILAVLNSIMSRVSTNVIFLDELFSNLDSATRTELIGVLRYILPSNCSVLIVSHQDMDNDLFDGQLRMTLMEDNKEQKYTNITYTYNSK